MKIHELNIIEFGCLKDRKISFNDGLNILSGENEAGKSTVLLFIKYMLYGLSKRTAAGAERDRSVSFDGHRASGSMTFEAEGKTYTVERHFQGTRGTDSFKLFSLDSGEKIDIDCQVGEYFLGVPKEVFESSAWIGQMRTTDINGEKTMSAIENLLVSADESVDAAKVVSGLDKVRTEYMHKNGGGGKLYRLGLDIADTREKLKTALERNAMLKEQREKLSEKESELEANTEEYRKAEKLYSEIRALSLIAQFDRLHSAEAELERVSREKKEFLDNNNGIVPDRREGETLGRALQEYRNAKEERGAAETVLSEIKETNADEALANEAKRIRALGGKETLVSKAEAILSSAASKKNLGVVFLVLALVFAVAVAGVNLANSWGMLPLFAVSPLLAALGIIFLVSSAKTKAKLTEALLGQSDVNALERYIDLCEENLQSIEQNVAAVSKAEGRLEAAVKRYNDAVLQLAGRLGKSSQTLTDKALEMLAEEKIKLIESACLRYDELISKENRTRETVRAIGEPIASYNEAELRASVETDVSEVTEQTLSEVASKRRFYETRLEAMRQSVRNISNTVSQLEANFTDPLLLADRLSALEEEQRESREFFDSLVLAIESISRAGERMQGNFTPEIGRRASDMISIISGGKYPELKTGKKLQPSLIQNGLPVLSELLSGGTRDAVYISLRIALMSQIFEDRMPPLLLDEALCQLDDSRAERMLALLTELSSGMQIILFTCHKREEEICRRLGAEINAIKL